MELPPELLVALAWVFEREQPSDANRANRLLAECGAQVWWVPGPWHLEVANALLVAERRGLITASASDVFLARLGSLPICTDADAAGEHQSRLMGLGCVHGLSGYDASDLELAHRLNAALASLDRRLNQAAADLGVRLHNI